MMNETPTQALEPAFRLRWLGGGSWWLLRWGCLGGLLVCLLLWALLVIWGPAIAEHTKCIVANLEAGQCAFDHLSLPRYPHSIQVQISPWQRVDSGLAEAQLISFQTDDTPAMVNAFYAQTLAGAGWQHDGRGGYILTTDNWPWAGQYIEYSLTLAFEDQNRVRLTLQKHDCLAWSCWPNSFFRPGLSCLLVGAAGALGIGAISWRLRRARRDRGASASISPLTTAND
ncbi:MAG: hypothetical protein HS126_30990 [Anaerolineales bacterium]|nr:hypothetical protein [Anaerolineales bacterium]